MIKFPQPPILDDKFGSISWRTWFSNVAKFFQPQTPVAVTYAANWSDYSASFQSVVYWLDACGAVHLSGMCKKSTATSFVETIFTLPVGYRPSKIETYLVAANVLDNGVRVNILPSGVVSYASTQTPCDYLSLSGITFRAV